jgi:hypothetical protein
MLLILPVFCLIWWRKTNRIQCYGPMRKKLRLNNKNKHCINVRVVTYLHCIVVNPWVSMLMHRSGPLELTWFSGMRKKERGLCLLLAPNNGSAVKMGGSRGGSVCSDLRCKQIPQLVFWCHDYWFIRTPILPLMLLLLPLKVLNLLIMHWLVRSTI